MKRGYFLTILTLALSAVAQTNIVHQWTLKNGKTIIGDYYTSGTSAVVIRNQGTNLVLNLDELSPEDRRYFLRCKLAARQKQLDVESAQLKTAGQIELSGKLMEHFPEKVVNKPCWVDATFRDLSDIGIYGFGKDYVVGFTLRDNDDRVFYCAVFKVNPNTKQRAPELDQLMQLKRGDRARFYGRPLEEEEGRRDLRFYVNRIQLIQTKVEADELESQQL